jgi:hypothetical protein
MVEGAAAAATYTGLFVPGPDGTDAIRPFGRSLLRQVEPEAWPGRQGEQAFCESGFMAEDSCSQRRHADTPGPSFNG